jgi:hypothetical protein
MDPVKVQGIAQWPVPTTVKGVRSFLGFCNFYRAFIPKFSDIARPLNDLTKKNQQWQWGPKEQAAFEELKGICITGPVLRTPDWNKPFIMETDASGYALGVVIAQPHEDGIHPIAFHSRSLVQAERNYDAHDKEMLGVIYGLKMGRKFFLGAQEPVWVRTDHKNLQYFREPQKLTGRQARWVTTMQDYNFILDYIPGEMNTVADALSHREDLNKGVSAERQILLPDSLFHICKSASHADNEYDSLFTCKIFLKDNPEERRMALHEIHDSPAGGHPGIANTWDLVKCQYDGLRLRQFVEDYVRGCAKCQESKPMTSLPKAPLLRFDTHAEEGPFQYVSMDLITDLPRSEGYDAILTIVDQGCSKAAKFIPCNKTIDAEGVAQEYLRHLVPWFGLPKRIISDCDPRFAS